MNELEDLKALLEERERIEKEIRGIRERLSKALALIDEGQAAPPAPPPAPIPAPVRDIPPPPLRLANHQQVSDDECVLYDCHSLALAGGVYCTAHAS